MLSSQKLSKPSFMDLINFNISKERQTRRSRRSMASRCGWMRMGVRRSLVRDSAMSVDSLYSSLASSCSRKWVDFLTLQRRKPKMSFSCARYGAVRCGTARYPAVRHSPASVMETGSPAALCQRHQNGHLIVGMLPKPGKRRNRETFLVVQEILIRSALCFSRFGLRKHVEAKEEVRITGIKHKRRKKD